MFGYGITISDKTQWSFEAIITQLLTSHPIHHACPVMFSVLNQGLSLSHSYILDFSRTNTRCRSAVDCLMGRIVFQDPHKSTQSTRGRRDNISRQTDNDSSITGLLGNYFAGNLLASRRLSQGWLRLLLRHCGLVSPSIAITSLANTSFRGLPASGSWLIDDEVSPVLLREIAILLR